jgi:putative intracellular protease/amidase
MDRYRKFLIFIIMLTMLTTGCSQQASPPATPRHQVLIILAEKSQGMAYMLKNEVMVMVDTLENAGIDAVLASPTGKILEGDTVTITPDLKLADVKVEDYAGVIFACMAADWASPFYPEPLRVAQKAAALKKPIAAQVHGTFALSIAGVLDGKQYALASELNDIGLVPNGIYKGEGIVQDGNIFTSGICPFMARLTGKPDGTKELMQKFIDYIKSDL